MLACLHYVIVGHSDNFWVGDCSALLVINEVIRLDVDMTYDDFRIAAVEAMAGPVSLELDPVFLKGLSYLHSKSKDSAEKLKALLDESLSRGSDTSYRLLQKVRI